MMVRHVRILTLVVAAAAIVCALSVGAASPAAAVQSVNLSPAREGIDYAADRVLVGLQPGTTALELDELRHASATLDDAPLTTGDLITCTDQDGVLVDDNDLTPVVTLSLRPGATVAQAIVNATAEYDDGQTAIVFMGHGTETTSRSCPRQSAPRRSTTRAPATSGRSVPLGSRRPGRSRAATALTTWRWATRAWPSQSSTPASRRVTRTWRPTS